MIVTIFMSINLSFATLTIAKEGPPTRPQPKKFPHIPGGSGVGIGGGGPQ